MKRGISLIILLSFILSFAGCAAHRYYKRAEKAMAMGRYDEAVEYFRKAYEKNPNNPKYKNMYERALFAAADYHFRKAERIVESNPDDIPTLESAVLEYQLAINYDPSHQYAAAKLQNTLRKIKRLREKQYMKESEIERIKEKVERARFLKKVISPRSKELIDVVWPKETSLKQIIDSMGKIAGINIVYDKDYRDTNFKIELRGVTFREALDQILSANGLFYKIVNENTIMIIPDTPNKRRQYEELVVKTFYLSNAAPQDAVNMLRTIAQIQRVVPIADLNAVAVKDTPEKVALAEKLVQMLDKELAEIILDVEILEVNRSVLKRYGIDISPGLVVTQSFDIGEGPGVIYGHQFKAIDAAAWAFNLPSLVYRAILTDSSTRVLARPQVRASDGKSVSIRLGNRVPIPVQTFQSIIGQQQGGIVAPITQYQLTDVGINIDITPRVHHNREVTLEIKFELSSIASPGSSPNEPPTLGNRSINTTIRLKDGETNLLAGLIRQDERQSMRTIPGINKIPILRDLFAANDRTVEQTDVIFTITPHIIRMPNITEDDLKPVWIGTEVNPQIKEPPGVNPFEEIKPVKEVEKGVVEPTLQPRALDPLLRLITEPEKKKDQTPPPDENNRDASEKKNDEPEPPLLSRHNFFEKHLLIPIDFRKLSRRG